MACKPEDKRHHQPPATGAVCDFSLSCAVPSCKGATLVLTAKMISRRPMLQPAEENVCTAMRAYMWPVDPHLQRWPCAHLRQPIALICLSSVRAAVEEVAAAGAANRGIRSAASKRVATALQEPASKCDCGCECNMMYGCTRLDVVVWTGVRRCLSSTSNYPPASNYAQWRRFSLAHNTQADEHIRERTALS